MAFDFFYFIDRFTVCDYANVHIVKILTQVFQYFMKLYTKILFIYLGLRGFL